jgi:hypothetical protein
MRYRTPTLAAAALLLAAVTITGCASTKAACPGLTGLPQLACETQAVVTQIETAQPQAFAVLDLVKANTTQDVQDRINQIEATWPPLKLSMDSLVAALNAGAQQDVAATLAKAVSFYVNLSALVVQVGGKALPGLPPTVTVNAVR